MAVYNEPMGFPQGSVRAIITFVLILALVVLVFMGKTSSYLEVLASAAFGYYFATRSSETSSTPRSESEVLVTPEVGKPEEEFQIVSGRDEE